MSADHNIPPGGGQGAAARFNAQFAQMNINAQPFVPNVQAQPFVPIGGQGIHGYPYSGYPMHGECVCVHVSVRASVRGSTVAVLCFIMVGCRMCVHTIGIRMHLVKSHFLWLWYGTLCVFYQHFSYKNGIHVYMSYVCTSLSTSHVCI